jgi:hypothetical protein
MLRVDYVFLLVIILCSINAQDGPIRAYGIRKDYFNGIKASEFSVYDISKTTLYYRIESKFSIMPKFDLIAYPSKKLVGKLESKVGAINLSVLDDKTGQWLTGTMKGHFSLSKQKYSMQFNDKQISMEKDLLSPHMNIRDETNGRKLLARYQREFFSPVTATTYGVQIYSNDIPDGLYLLILAWTDIGRSESWGTTKRKNG